MVSADLGTASKDVRFGRLLLALLGCHLIFFAGTLLAGWSWEHTHPAWNAMLNGSALVLLLFGRGAIKTGDEELHRKTMIAAFLCSSIFLASYLARYAISGTHKYPGTGWPKAFYLLLLLTHMVLAMALVPMVLRTLYLAIKGERTKHRRLARITWPIWIYVSMTGVLVYFMLYQWA